MQQTGCTIPPVFTNLITDFWRTRQSAGRHHLSQRPRARIERHQMSHIWNVMQMACPAALYCINNITFISGLFCLILFMQHIKQWTDTIFGLLQRYNFVTRNLQHWPY